MAAWPLGSKDSFPAFSDDKRARARMTLDSGPPFRSMKNLPEVLDCFSFSALFFENNQAMRIKAIARVNLWASAAIVKLKEFMDRAVRGLPHCVLS